MTEQVYPPPPPPPSESSKGGFHGPETHFFTSIRRHLTILEQSQAPLGKSPGLGLLLALVLAATLSFALSFVVQLPFAGALAAGLTAESIALLVLIAPITEEIFKGISIVLVALFVWKTIPSRRYGAVLGAAAGFGFAISENILYSFSGQGAETIASRWISIPFMHVVWSAFVGMGIFVFLAQRQRSHSSPSWLALLFFAFGLINHILWNAVATALNTATASAFIITVLDILLIFAPFGLMLRDFLGGHFNFFDFLKQLPEPVSPAEPTQPPPPPPPP